MLTKNIDVDSGLTNGALGLVNGFHGSERVPLVSFSRRSSSMAVPLAAEEFIIMSGSQELARRVQVPLRLGWALTIHKAQGLTLDSVVVDLHVHHLRYGICCGQQSP
mmetsp:Transcript_84867/g.226442  ORF Transcript_84867/g.226442 Transcript_84867/m.226442 type:complete len:107 (-) Transcript_84867:285-605(-)